MLYKPAEICQLRSQTCNKPTYKKLIVVVTSSKNSVTYALGIFMAFSITV